MPLYESNPQAAPDSQFEPGELKHVVAGNTGRMLDPRRTPVSILDVRTDIGCFILRIEGFEDRGAEWTIPFEKIDRYQFAGNGHSADEHLIARYRLAITRLNRPLRIDPDAARRQDTERRIHKATAEAADWLRAHSRFFAEGGLLPVPVPDPGAGAGLDPGAGAGPNPGAGAGVLEGDERLQADLARSMTDHDLHDMEHIVARTYVSNPYSGEVIKGHCIVLAELGLAVFDDTIVRDAATFEGAWHKRRRAEHIVRRLAFIRAMFGLLDRTHIMLYRGLSTDGDIKPREDTLISASFSRAIAEHHYHAAGEDSHGSLIRQRVPIERLFMTYIETAAMNQMFKEAEAVLLADAQNPLF